MTAPVVSRPAEHTSGPGRLWWLPAGGQGNGLDDDAWAPVLQVSQQIVPILLSVLGGAGVPAYAAPARPVTARLRDTGQRPESSQLQVGTSAYGGGGSGPDGRDARPGAGDGAARRQRMALTGARQISGAALCFAAVAVLAARAGDDGSLARADRMAFERVWARRSQAGIAVARAVSAVAEPVVAYPVLAMTGALAAPRTGWRKACMPCLVVAGGAAARRLASQLMARPRPPAEAWLITPEGFSLPSKHTTLAALTAGACVRTLTSRTSAARSAPLLAAAVVGASRVYLGVHWPTDVIAGWLFADGWLLLAGSRTLSTT